MAVTFESYERRIDQIKPVMEKYGIKDFEDALNICKEKGFNPYDITKSVQPICFENAAWAYTLGAAIAIKKGCVKAADAAKAIGILMVVFGHNWLDEKFCYYFYSFHMPLFFILAGITFSTKKDFADFSWKKFKTLIIPYLFFSVCIMVVYWIMSYTHSGDYNIRSEVFSYLKQQRHTHLWFLPVLFASE